MKTRLSTFRSLIALAALFLPSAVLTFSSASPALANWYTTSTITGPAGSGIFGRAPFSAVSQRIVTLANGNLVVVDPEFDHLGNSNVGAVHVYDGATLNLLSTITGSTVNDSIGNGFSNTVPGIVVLEGSSNFLIVSPDWDRASSSLTDNGAVTWVNGSTGIPRGTSADPSRIYQVTLTNSLVGGFANGEFLGSGGVVVLSNGNYVVSSPRANAGGFTDSGAVTWCNGTTGCAGEISSSNSIIGSSDFDATVQSTLTQNLVITTLNNGNYVIRMPLWNNGTVVDVGLVAWCSGTTGCTGSASSSRGIYGSTTDDQVGSGGVTALSNGNFVVRSSLWDLSGSATNVGAVTWCNGTTGCTAGQVTTSNSLHGTTTGNDVGGTGIAALTNGNYVVQSSSWDNGSTSNVGAATWCNGTTGCTGPVTTSNSLHGGLPNDNVTNLGVTALTNGNYVVHSTVWDLSGSVSDTDVGAATWCNGTTGCTGPVTTSNSLHGTTASDQIGGPGAALTNGNYVVRSSAWDNGSNLNAGAVTWCNGTTGCTAGPVTTSNSLHGASPGDGVGGTGIAALTNGNYVVRSSSWDNGSTSNVGAATWCNGTTGCTGPVTTSNSLHGTTASDSIADTGLVVVPNGHYVVFSRQWDLSGSATNVGAVTWCNGTTGCTGPVTTSNSLHGSTTNDEVGNAQSSSAPLTLTGGSQQNNLILRSPLWNNISPAITDVGAISLFDTSTAGPRTVGPISSSNSVLGTIASQSLGNTAPVRFDSVNDRVYVHNANNSTIVTVISLGAGSSTSGSGSSSSGSSTGGAVPVDPPAPSTTSTTPPRETSSDSSRTGVTIAEFADNSPRLSADLRRQVRAVVDRFPTLKAVECKGFVRTSRPANARQLALADSRARNVCALFKQLKPSLETTISRGSATDNRRRVRLTLTK